jgi:enoyl-CoA hydratase/carnithine racemase
MSSGENRFNPTFLQAVLDTLDMIENDTDAAALVMTSAHEKIFSNGIDLEWMIPVIKGGDTAAFTDFFDRLNGLFKRLLTYPMVTIAAINGHAFAGGAIVCGAFDVRFMRSDRGFFCLPEVDLGIPFLPGMNALLKKAVPLSTLIEMQLSGCRLTADQCQQKGIVAKALHGDQLLPEALAYAKTIRKHRPVVAELKKRLYKDILQVLDDDDPPLIQSGRFNIDIPGVTF